MKFPNFLTSFSLFLILVLTSCTSKDPNSPSFVVAKGKGLQITREELTEERNAQMKLTNVPLDKIPQTQIAVIDAQVLEQMINRELLLNQAGKSTEQIKNQAQEQVERIRKNFADEASFKAQLDKAGLTAEKMREEIEEQLRIEQFLSQQIKTEETQPNPTDVEAFYHENAKLWEQPDLVQVRHILIRVTEPSSTEEKVASKKMIDEARKRIAGGEAFDKVARELSQDPASAQQGGLLPPFARNQMAPEFEKAAFSQELKKLGPVITTSYGYHIIEVQDRRAARTIPIEEVREDIFKHLAKMKRNRLIQALIAKMRTEAGVQILLPVDKAALPKQTPPPGM